MKQSVRVGPAGTRCNPPAHSQHPQNLPAVLPRRLHRWLSGMTPLSCDCFTISIPVKMVPRALSHRVSSVRCSPSLPRHTPCRPNANRRATRGWSCGSASNLTSTLRSQLPWHWTLQGDVTRRYPSAGAPGWIMAALFAYRRRSMLLSKRHSKRLANYPSLADRIAVALLLVVAVENSAPEWICQR